MKTTIRDIAKRANVSVATVSLALNNRAGINKKTKEEVLRIADELHYVANQSARGLVMKDSGFIGLVVPEIINPFYSSVLDIMSGLAEKKGYTILLGISNNKASQEKACIETFASRSASGVIIVPSLKEASQTDYLEMLSRAKIPMVFCTEYYEEWNNGTRGKVPCVMTDFEQGEYEGIKHLISRGLRKICFVSGNSGMHYAQLRLKGYSRALEEAGIPLDERNLFFLSSTSSSVAYSAADEILAQRPEAIACINDFMAISIMKRMYERGIDIPGDISIMGFDDVMFSELLPQRLTTINQGLNEISERTMSILDEQVKGSSIHNKANEIYFVKPSLFIRDTTR